MKWNKYTIKTVPQAEDIIISTLMDLGIEGVEIEDRVPLTEEDKKQMFVDILPDVEDDGIAWLSFYLEEDADTETLLEQVKKELSQLSCLMEIGEGTMTQSVTEDKDWVNNWKQYFKQFYVDDILIKPSWEEVKPEDKDKLLIQIDPGTAFGTGMHETTQLCIRQLKKYVNENTRLLDVGCGSGILSITALKLGAAYAVGTDLDPNAVHATEENMEVNHIPRKQFEVMIGNIIEDRQIQEKAGFENYDIVVANILADVLVPLTPVIVKQMKQGAVYITSGIIEGKEQLVADAAVSAGLRVMEMARQGEWFSVIAVKE